MAKVKLDNDMTSEELQACLKGDFTGPSSIDRIIVGIPMFIFTIVGLHLNITLWRIISLHKGLLDLNFKRHVLSLICTSIGYNLTGLLTMLPVVAFGILYPDNVLIILSTPDSLFYQVTLYHNLTIVIDRCITIITPGVHKRFTGKAQFFFVLSPWILSAWITGHSTYLGCHKRFNPYLLRFDFGCSGCPFYFDLFFYSSNYVPVAIFVMYFSLFASILRRKYLAGRAVSIKNQKNELRFAIQFAIISVFQVCASQFFWIAGYITSDVALASLMMLTASCVNTYTNPVVMIMFQPRVRKSYTAWSKRLWLFSADAKGVFDNTPSAQFKVPSGTRSDTLTGSSRI